MHDLACNQLAPQWTAWTADTGTGTRPNQVSDPVTPAERYDPYGPRVRR